MRGLLVAGALCAGHVSMAVSALAEINTYHACVQDCREKLPPETTLKQCILENKCHQYPRERWTYEDCVERCQDQVNLDGESLQRCIARYVCSQHPRR